MTAVIIGASDHRRHVRDALAHDIRQALEAHTGTPEVDAVLFGTSADDTYGREHAVWIAATVDPSELASLRLALARIARAHGQEAIALTVGAFSLVTSEEHEHAAA